MGKKCSQKVCEVLCVICENDAKIGAELNVQLSFYNRVQQRHIMKSQVYICSAEKKHILLSFPCTSPYTTSRFSRLDTLCYK